MQCLHIVRVSAARDGDCFPRKFSAPKSLGYLHCLDHVRAIEEVDVASTVRQIVRVGAAKSTEPDGRIFRPHSTCMS